jgi:predicted PilT family ATPase
MTVPDKMVGLIIGRGGEQITRLQAESGCRIQMAEYSQGNLDELVKSNQTASLIFSKKKSLNFSQFEQLKKKRNYLSKTYTHDPQVD